MRNKKEGTTDQKVRGSSPLGRIIKNPRKVHKMALFGGFCFLHFLFNLRCWIIVEIIQSRQSAIQPDRILAIAKL